MTETVSISEALAFLSKELKSARMAKNLSLDDVSRQISIQKSYLEKIEEGDFSFLSRAYVFAYIKSYANYLGVGDEERIEQCRNDLKISGASRITADNNSGSKESKKELRKSTSSESRVTNSLLWKSGILLIVVVAAIAVYLFSSTRFSLPYSAPPAVSVPSTAVDDTVAVAEQIVDSVVTTGTDKPPPVASTVQATSSDSVSQKARSAPEAALKAVAPKSLNSASNNPAVAATQSVSAVQKRAEPSPVSARNHKVLIVKVVKDYSWVKVVADDSAKVYPGASYKSGQEIRYEASKKLWVNIGRPGCVELYLNGKKLPPFTSRTLILE
jgi:cytoskeleton protein RodZ